MEIPQGDEDDSYILLCAAQKTSYRESWVQLVKVVRPIIYIPELSS